MTTAANLFRYCFEGFTLFIVLMFFESPEKMTAHAVAFILAYLFPAIILAIFAQRLQQLSFLVLLIVSAALFLFAWMLGFSPFVALLISLAAGWRSFKSFLLTDAHPDDRFNDLYVFILSLILALFVSLSADSTAVLFLVVFLQLLFLFATRAAATFAAGTRPSALFQWIGGTFAVLTAVSVGIVFLFPVVKWFVISILQGFVRTIGLVISIAVYWLVSLLHLSNLGSSKLTNSDSGLKSVTPIIHSNLSRLSGHDSFSWETVFWITVIILFLLTAILYAKKKINLGETKRQQAAKSMETSRPLKIDTNMRRRRIRSPKNRVRKKLFQLHKQFSRLGIGRRKGQTVSEWFADLDLSDDAKEKVASGYVKVRYGGQLLSLSEWADYEAAVDAMMAEAKTKYERKRHFAPRPFKR
ncbi:MAG TPA: DUF4129 domain-containing protein [Bacillales bacterium]|nr:DUF4129 domain-containing protein [Bacillales bacterium]